jgi:glutamine amidotransferase
MKIAIVDYGMGNISSISSTLKYLGISELVITDNFENLNSSDKIILPGVGSFAEAINTIKEKKIDLYLNKIIAGKRIPILGICLGMQLLAKSSDEDGFNEGLGFVNAIVNKFTNPNLKIPHIGFNQVNKNHESVLFKNLPNNSDFYFTHSYKMTTETNINQSYCYYGDHFIAAFEYKNIYGTQFHPELSQNNGIQLLKNFIEI